MGNKCSGKGREDPKRRKGKKEGQGGKHSKNWDVGILAIQGEKAEVGHEKGRRRRAQGTERNRVAEPAAGLAVRPVRPLSAGPRPLGAARPRDSRTDPVTECYGTVRSGTKGPKEGPRAS